MEKGYGFGAEGDWKTAAMLRIMKIMTEGMKDAKGTSFMEDYTYNLVPVSYTHLRDGACRHLYEVPGDSHIHL